ncbi:MAG: signal peptide peptidase SppA, partial [Leptolyngbyaceae cyanobacterium RM2_2_21]|nr:signal peptide peptidase SppA [Leptolyngbyaceae cyanobacterium RM2_2_21]
KVIKSGPYKDILAFDRELTQPEQTILQELIDVSYQQFVETVATGRNLAVETVKGFADGRIFTGQQALELGVVDRLGTEEDARRWAAELAGLNPDKAECYTFEERKPFWTRFLPGNRTSDSPLTGLALTALSNSLAQLEFDLTTSGLPLWLYRP